MFVSDTLGIGQGTKLINYQFSHSDRHSTPCMYLPKPRILSSLALQQARLHLIRQKTSTAKNTPSNSESRLPTTRPTIASKGRPDLPDSVTLVVVPDEISETGVDRLSYSRSTLCSVNEKTIVGSYIRERCISQLP